MGVIPRCSGTFFGFVVCETEVVILCNVGIFWVKYYVGFVTCYFITILQFMVIGLIC